MAQQQQRYRVLDRLASGGMAEVYRAESAGLEGFKKTVAIKRVLPHLAEKKQFIGMFLDEARLSAQLNHSNCAQVFDIGVGDNTYFIVMEYVDGADLKAIQEYLAAKRQHMSVPSAMYICCKICEGLSYAHDARDSSGTLLGIVHRDVSPPNVLITRHGEIKVVDFGLAKANSQLEHSEPGIIKGKFSYLSPEAALGESVDLRADIFAVGTILWELLTSQRLFFGETDLQTVRKVQTAEIPSIRAINPEVTPELEAVTKKALARDPKHRYQSAREFGRDLTRLLFAMGKPVSAYELAELIAEVVSERDKKKARQKSSLIGTLIEDAMMEFTSLDSKGSQNMYKTLHSTTTSLASQPLDTLGAVKDWAADLGLNPASATPVSHYSAGNLAALEDDAPGLPLLPKGVPGQPGVLPVQPLGSWPPAGEQPVIPRAAPVPTLPPQGRSNSNNGAIAVVVALVLAAGVAGAYLSGLMQ